MFRSQLPRCGVSALPSPEITGFAYVIDLSSTLVSEPVEAWGSRWILCAWTAPFEDPHRMYLKELQVVYRTVAHFR